MKSLSPHRVDSRRLEACTKETLGHHYDILQALNLQHDYNTQLIFNCDATNSGVKIVCPCSMQSVFRREDPPQVHITLLFAVSAAGDHLKPLAIMPCKELPLDTVEFAEHFNWMD